MSDDLVASGIVFYSRKAAGWPSTGKGRPKKHEVISLRDALKRRWDRDAWYQPVRMAGTDETQHRINKAIIGKAEVFLTAVFVDFDLRDEDGKKREWLDADEEMDACGVLYNLAASKIAKPFVYSTAHGARLVWPLADPVPGEYADSWLDQFYTHAKKQNLTKGTALTWDENAEGWNHCYRLPHVLRDEGYWSPAYTRLHNADVLTWEPPNRLVTDAQAHRREYKESADAPDLTPLEASEWLHIPPQYRAKLQAGGPLYGEGQRNSGTLNELLPNLSNDISKYAVPDSDIVYRALAPGVIAQGCEPTLARLWEVVHRICLNDGEATEVGFLFGQVRVDDSMAVEAVEEAEEAEAKAADPGAAANVKKAAERARRKADRAVEKLDQERERAITNAQLAQAVSKARKAGETPMLVYSGDQRSAYVYYPAARRYYAKPKDTITTTLEREHDLSLRTEKGGLLRFPDVFDQLGKDAHAVHIQYWLPGRTEHYDAEQRLLYKVSDAPSYDVKAAYHEDVARWLRLLASTDQQHDYLVDWLAVVPELSHPVAALFLCGPRGTGKTLFADGVASLWGYKANYNAVIGNAFNEQVSRTPVLVADDGMKLKDGRAVDAFKELITQRFHEVNAKYRPVFYMDGCPRVIISGNGVDSVQLPATGTHEHNMAVAERLIYIQCSKEARDYLEKTDTTGWAMGENKEPGKIAEHMLWLHANHTQVTPKGRLLVSGDLHGDWQVQRSANSEGLDGAILSALAKWAVSGQATPGIGLLHEDGEVLVLVNSEKLRERWAELTLDRVEPRPRTLARALASLSSWPKSRTMTIRDMRLRCHAVDSRLVLTAAEVAGIGNDADLKQFFSRVAKTAGPSQNRETVQ